MIILFTDFGLSGPYIGQMRAVLARQAAGVPVINLFADLPAHDIEAAAHLLAAYQQEFEDGSVFVCVVDPGVGSLQRAPMVLHADSHWYVGPHNGLFDVVAARSTRVEAWRILWQPARLSASFHGRDLFAPVAATLARGDTPEMEPLLYAPDPQMGADLPRIIYIDHFGNLITGVRASTLAPDVSVRFKERLLPRVRTFSEVSKGEPLCYENSSGLLEIAVNQGRAEQLFGAKLGESLQLG